MRSRVRFVSLLLGLTGVVLVASPSWGEDPLKPTAPDSERPTGREATEAGSAATSWSRDPVLDKTPWAVTLYGGVYLDNSLGQTFALQWDPLPSYIGVLAVSREIGTVTKHLRFEVEGQIAKHFREEWNWEFNALIVARWVTFPWNDYVYTTFAVGEGLSYATEVPKLEKQLQNTSEQTLNYMMFELTVSPPQHREWAFVTRIHHRSAVFGLLGNGDSNMVCAGIKYRF